MNSSSASSQSIPASKGLKEAMRRHPLFSFFFLAYAFSWILFIPYVLAEWGYLEGDYTFFYILHVFGPALAAVVTTSVVDGKAGWQNMRQRIRQRSAHWAWYAFILLGIPALVMLGIVVQPGALTGFKGFTTSLLAGYPFYLAAAFLGLGLVRNPVGAALRCRGCSPAMVRCGAPSSWVFCGAAGICRTFSPQAKAEARTPALMSS